MEEAHDGAESLLGHALGLFRIEGEDDGDRDGARRRPLELADHQPARVGGGGPVDEPPVVAGAVGDDATELAGVDPQTVLALSFDIAGRGADGDRSSAARRDVQRDGESEVDPTAPPLQSEWRGGGDVKGQRLVFAAPTGHDADRVDLVTCSRGRTDKRFCLLGLGHPDPQAGRRVDPKDQWRACRPVGWRVVESEPGELEHDKWSEEPDHQHPEDEVTEELHPARSPVVRHEPPDGQDGDAAAKGRQWAGRARPAPHGRGVGIVSRSSSTKWAAKPTVPSSPSMRMR